MVRTAPASRAPRIRGRWGATPPSDGGEGRRRPRLGASFPGPRAAVSTRAQARCLVRSVCFHVLFLELPWGVPQGPGLVHSQEPWSSCSGLGKHKRVTEVCWFRLPQPSLLPGKGTSCPPTEAAWPDSPCLRFPRADLSLAAQVGRGSLLGLAGVWASKQQSVQRCTGV